MKVALVVDSAISGILWSSSESKIMGNITADNKLMIVSLPIYVTMIFIKILKADIPINSVLNAIYALHLKCPPLLWQAV